LTRELGHLFGIHRFTVDSVVDVLRPGRVRAHVDVDVVLIAGNDAAPRVGKAIPGVLKKKKSMKLSN
jgi:hypothetical protein